MDGPLWTPSADRIARANLTRFGGGRPYAELYDWSIAHPDAFWREVWEFAGIPRHGRAGGDRYGSAGRAVLLDATLNLRRELPPPER